MDTVLERELLVVTGKGGVGKTTVAAALGTLAARRGLRTIVVEVGGQSRLADMFGVSASEPGAEIELEPGLTSISIDPDRALLEWLQALGGRLSGRVLASSGTFQYFAAAAPGAKEIVTMVKVWKLTRGEGGRDRGYDLVVLDGPATGHVLGMMRSPRTFGAIARVGPVAGQTRKVGELLRDPARAAYLAVALGSEMAVTETLELQDGLERELQRRLEGVIVNGLLPRRFTAAELELIGGLGENGRAGATGRPGGRASEEGAVPVARAAARAARAVHERSRQQHNQVQRLRRRRFEVLSLPFLWAAAAELEAVREIARQLERRLSGPAG